MLLLCFPRPLSSQATSLLDRPTLCFPGCAFRFQFTLSRGFLLCSVLLLSDQGKTKAEIRRGPAFGLFFARGDFQPTREILNCLLSTWVGHVAPPTRQLRGPLHYGSPATRIVAVGWLLECALSLAEKERERERGLVLSHISQGPILNYSFSG